MDSSHKVAVMLPSAHFPPWLEAEWEAHLKLSLETHREVSLTVLTGDTGKSTSNSHCRHRETDLTALTGDTQDLGQLI